jgi:DNA end-binding protein Ku
MTEEWDPAQYTNTYHHDLMARIKEKVKEGATHEITPASKEERPRTAQVIDLADLLKQSLGKAGKAPARKAAHSAAKSHPKRKRA